MAFAILRYEKLKTLGNVGSSLSHNYRTIETPNAEKNKTLLNEHTFKTRNEALDAIKNRLPENRRKDAVPCIEFLITASPDWDGWNTKKEKAFFDQSKKWLEEKYGKDNVCSVSIHRDETTPHLVAYVVPLNKKGVLSAKTIIGNRSTMSETQSSFAEEVKQFGLERGKINSKAQHKTIQHYYEDAKKYASEPILELPRPVAPEPIKNALGFAKESREDYAERVIDDVMMQMQQVFEQHQKQLKIKQKQLDDEKKRYSELNYRTRFYTQLTNEMTHSEISKLNNSLVTQRIEFENYREMLAVTKENRKKKFEENFSNYNFEPIFSLDSDFKRIIERQKKAFINGNESVYDETMREKYKLLTSYLPKIYQNDVKTAFEKIVEADKNLEYVGNKKYADVFVDFESEKILKIAEYIELERKQAEKNMQPRPQVILEKNRGFDFEP
jgi:hypothetical protein